MAAVHRFPLIAVTEVFDMPSVDNPYGDGTLGPTEEILERKLEDVTGIYPWGKGHGYGWPADIEFDNPIHIVDDGYGNNPYCGRLDPSYRGRKVMGNGHHRLAFQALVQGALFVPYCEEISTSGW